MTFIHLYTYLADFRLHSIVLIFIMLKNFLILFDSINLYTSETDILFVPRLLVLVQVKSGHIVI